LSSYYLQAVFRKLEIAKRLNAGEINGSYSEALMIISSILSATASMIYPGYGIDKRRFVELLIKYNTTDYEFSKISIPLLKESRILTKEQDLILLEEYNTKSYSLIITGEDIDLDESIVRTLCPDIDLRKLREFSYANLFYKELRSSLVHEYRLSDFAASFPQTTKEAFVSYNNNVHYPTRRICFHFNPLKEITENISSNVADLIEVNQKQKFEQTNKEWWLDG
jgi:hypothetical protein